MVRRDQDGGLRSEKSGQRFPFLFCAFVCSTCRFVVFSLRSHARLLFPLSSGPRSEPTKSRAKPDGFSLVHLIVPLVKYREGDRRWSEVRIYLANSFQLVRARRRENPPVIFFLHFGRASSSVVYGERDSGDGKLEDLVRLALKRLNVSYLTISSRLVWFERETLVCHERGCKRCTRFLNHRV